MKDNQNINSELLQQLTETHRHAPTVSRFVEEYFSELVPHSDYFAHLVRDDVGGEMLPPLPEEVIARLPRYYTAVPDLYATPTKPEEVLARLPREFTRADAVRVGGEFGVSSRTIERYLTIWQKTNVIESVSRGHYRRIAV